MPSARVRGFTRQARGRRTLIGRAALLAPLLCAGCFTGGPTNPSFAITNEQGREALATMEQLPRKLDRPLVIISGYRDSHAPDLQRVMHATTGDSRIVAISLGAPDSFGTCRKKIIDAVDTAWPSSDPIWTTEVDVVAVSLGGLAARYAAAPMHPADRRLCVLRIFTIASPHRGAVIAKNYIGSSQLLWHDVRPASQFLAQLAATDASATYTLYPYARLHDMIVGEHNTAPDGRTPMWVPSSPFTDGHDDIWNDPRMLADICRRLRGEPPFATLPPAPLPP